MTPTHPKRMLVEGLEDCHAIIHLMKAFIDWPNEKEKRPIEIIIEGSATEILNRAKLSTYLKSSQLRALGIVVDADDNPQGRWQSLRDALDPVFANMPDRPPANGWIGEKIKENSERIRAGVWIMPNNSLNGMLENFLQWLVPSSSEPILNLAKEAFVTATNQGAPCRACHQAKAEIHTWLAWQDPPGERFGFAIAKRTLDPLAPAAKPFVEWFSRLYQLGDQAAQ